MIGLRHEAKNLSEVVLEGFNPLFDVCGVAELFGR